MPAPVSRTLGAVAEIGLLLCENCGHGRSAHIYCNDFYPALCTHLHAEKLDEDGYPDVCWCLQFIEPEPVASPSTKETENDG